MILEGTILGKKSRRLGHRDEHCLAHQLRQETGLTSFWRSSRFIHGVSGAFLQSQVLKYHCYLCRFVFEIIYIHEDD